MVKLCSIESEKEIWHWSVGSERKNAKRDLLWLENCLLSSNSKQKGERQEKLLFQSLKVRQPVAIHLDENKRVMQTAKRAALFFNPLPCSESRISNPEKSLSEPQCFFWPLPERRITRQDNKQIANQELGIRKQKCQARKTNANKKNKDRKAKASKTKCKREKIGN